MANMNPVEIGNVAASGWRAKVADAVAGPVSERTPLKPDQARAVVGLAFFALSVLYVVKTTRAAAEQIRG
jgi:ABC-type Mn2+/Zn2+ transport system permease subunit